MSLLALDVGFANCGWVVFRAGEPVGFGTITTEKSSKKTVRTADDNAGRAAELAKALKEVIEEYDVRGIIGELPSGGAQSARALAQMAMATGIVAAVATLLNIPAEWATPTEVKKAVTGLRGASKDEMMNAIRAKFPDIAWPKTKTKFEHIADACGVYLALENGVLVRLLQKSS